MRKGLIWGALVVFDLVAWTYLYEALPQGKQDTITIGTTTGTASSGRLLAPGRYVAFDLDAEPDVTCHGWDYAKAAPVGCVPHDVTFRVAAGGRTYELSRLDLRAALLPALRARKPVKP